MVKKKKYNPTHITRLISTSIDFRYLSFYEQLPSLPMELHHSRGFEQCDLHAHHL